MGYVILGKARKGKWAGQTVIMGSLSSNALAKNMETAELYLARIRKSMENSSDPEIDPASLEIAKVVTGDSAIEL